MDRRTWDVVVVGGGAAGLSAALVLAQANRQVLVVDDGRPRNRFDDHMHGYLSRDGTDPAELLAMGREEVARFGGEIRSGTVTRAERREEDGGWPRFTLTVDDGTVLEARRVVLATGLTDALPAIDGIEPFWGKEVFHCPYCHGVQIRAGAVVGVVGCGAESVAEAHMLLQWADHVVLLTNDCVDPTPDDEAGLRARGIDLHAGPVRAVRVEDGRIAGVLVGDQTLPIDELLVSPSTCPNRELLDQLGVSVADEPDECGVQVPSDDGGLTDVRGVYVTGNLRDCNIQVVDAVGHGVRAAIALSADLTEELVAEAIAGTKGR